MEPSELQVPPPADWQDFERWLRDLYEAEWGPPVEMHGRSGQPQCGVDIYGQPNGDGYHGIQCKRHDALNAAVTEVELKAEIAKARGFKPALAHFILATTAPRDVKIQSVIRQLNKRKRKPFTVKILFWADILALYSKHREVFHRHYPFVSPIRSPLHQLPSIPSDFIGRTTELDTLLTRLGPAGAAIAGAASLGGLVGMGGVGKTALAIVAAHRLAEHYPDAQLFIELRGASEKPLTPAEALTAVLQCIDPAHQPSDDVPALRKLYLEAFHGRRALILADDSLDAAQVRPLLPPPGCLLLVTSRHHFIVEGLKPIRVDCLPEPDAIHLVLTICPRIDDHVAALARACGCLPLALRAASSFLNVRYDIAPATYLADLADEARQLEAIGTEGVEISVEASLFLSYRQLSADVQRVLRALSIFPAPFDAAAEAAVCGDANNTHMGTLLRYSLAEFDEKDQRYRLHDLVRLFARRRLDEPPSAPERFSAEARHARHFCAVLVAAKELYKKGNASMLEGLALFDREWPNIEAGQAWAARHADTDPAAARLAKDYPDVGVYVLDLRLHPRQQIDWLTAALAAARRLKDREAEGNHLGNLGIAHFTLGDARKAIEFYEQALVIDREIGDQRGEGAALGNLGLAHAAVGDARKAIEFYEQRLAIASEIGDRRGEGTAVGNLGLAHADLGDARKAIEFYEQRLAITREIGDRRGEGAALGGLGSAHADLGDAHKAIEFYEQALIIAREIGDRRGEGNALGGLGSAHYALGDACKAIGFYEQALVIDREIGDRRGEGAALGNLGLAHAALGDARKAIELYEQALVIDREIGDRQGEANASWNLGRQLVKHGEIERGVALMRIRVDYLRELGHPDAEKAVATVEGLRRGGK